MPGDLSQRQRHHGDFMWHQIPLTAVRPTPTI
jgi:hypothetical protein